MTAKHAAEKHIRRDTEIDGDSANIRFGGDVQKSFSALEEIVRDSPHFDKDLLMNVHELASGKEYSVRSAVTNVGYIAREIMKYVHATGDNRARLMLGDLLEQISGFEKGSSDVSVVVPQHRRR